MQYFQGTITATDGSNIITGEGTKFLGNVFPGNELRVIGIDVPWTVAFVDSDTQLRLNANYAGVGGSGLEYSITRDYTSRKNFPIPNPGDRELVHLLGQAIRQIDSMIMASKTDLGIENVDNTSDVNKPVSTAQQQALDLKADKAPTEQGLADRYTKAELTAAIGNIMNPMCHLPLMEADDAIKLKGDFRYICESDTTHIDRHGVLIKNTYYSGTPTYSDAFSITDESATFGSLDGYVAYLTDGVNEAYRWVDAWTGTKVLWRKPVGFNATSYKLSRPRFEKEGLLIEGASTNLVHNNTMQGAVVGVIGSGGAWPTRWSRSGVLNGLSSEVVAFGEEDGINYIDYRWYGTPVGTGDTGLYFEDYMTTPASVGDTYTSSCFVTLAGGSTTNVREFQIRVGERDASGNFLTDGITVFTPSAGSLAYARKEHTRTMQHASVEYARCHVVIGYTEGQPIDITLRIGMPQFEKLPFASSVIPTFGTAVTRAAVLSNFNMRGNMVGRHSSFSIVVDADSLGDHRYQSVVAVNNSGDDSTKSTRMIQWMGTPDYLRAIIGTSVYVNDTQQNIIGTAKRLAMSVDVGGSIKFSVNGAIVGTAPATEAYVFDPDSGASVILGASTLSGAHPLYGHIRNLRIYDHALTAAEMALA